MLFRPLRPRRVLGLTVQGLFLRRQQEVAHDYGNLIADQLLTPEKIWIAVLQGPLSDRVLALLQRHVKQAVDEQAGAARSEEHTSELQSLMRISYAVFCLKTKIKENNNT